jgi:hypothetical protein
MLGFLVGTVSLLALVRTLRRWRWERHGGHCGGHGHHHGHFGHHHGGWRRGGWGLRGMLRGVFHYLDTTPGQEKVILKEMEAVESAWRTMRQELRDTRGEVAGFMRKESLSDVNWDEFMGRQGKLMDGARQTLRDAFLQIHAALDEAQRHKLADMMDNLQRHHGGFGGHGEVI